jgi:regulatory protein
MPKVTALEVQKRNKERVNVYLDGEFAFGLDLMAAAALRRGQDLTAAEIANLQAQDEVSKAVERALRFLSYRPRSESEVRRNLAKKPYPEPVIEAAIERIIRLGYLDDSAFANFWVENRDTFKPLSPRALRYELRQKGVAEEHIAAALVDLDTQDAAYRAAQGRVRRYQQKTRTEFRQKLGAFLQRRGFNYGTIRDVLEQLINELETQDQEFFTDEE